MALRKATMGELLAKYAEAAQAQTNDPTSEADTKEAVTMSGALVEKKDSSSTSTKMPPPARTRGTKRTR